MIAMTSKEEYEEKTMEKLIENKNNEIDYINRYETNCIEESQMYVKPSPKTLYYFSI